MTPRDDNLPEPNVELHLTRKIRARRARRVMTQQVKYNQRRCPCWKRLEELKYNCGGCGGA